MLQSEQHAYEPNGQRLEVDFRVVCCIILAEEDGKTSRGMRIVKNVAQLANLPLTCFFFFFISSRHGRISILMIVHVYMNYDTSRVTFWLVLPPRISCPG